MGIFITFDKSNYDTIETVEIEYRGVDVTFKLKEWDLYERFLVFRNTHRCEGVSVIASVQDGYSTIHDCEIRQEIARETYGWRKENGPHHDLTFQIRHAWNEVKAEIDEYLDRGVELADAVNEVVDR